MSVTDTVFVPDAELPTFGRFHPVGELGSGAMGTVYRARDESLGRDVAIKTLYAIRHDTTLRERFLREARAVSVLSHPNIVSIYDIGAHDEEPYLVMELAVGGSLKSHISSRPLPVEQARQLGIQIAHALAAAHAREILHRDVKPANILATGTGMWKLADFGIARLPGSRLTITGQFIGSPAYAAPESLTQGKFSPASDVYGLAATLYEAVTGQTPHGVHDLGSLIQYVDRDPIPAGQRVPLPASVDAAITRALARDPARRPSAEQFAHLLAEREASVAPVRGTALTPAIGSWRNLGLVVLLIAGVAAAILSSRSSTVETAANIDHSTATHTVGTDRANRDPQPRGLKHKKLKHKSREGHRDDDDDEFDDDDDDDDDD